MKINRALIFENIGEASMCWSDAPSGVFQTERAERLANEIVEHAEQVLQAEREKVQGLVDALEFYADSSYGNGAWCFRKKFLFDCIHENDLEYVSGPVGGKGERYISGGKTARQALVKYKEQK